MNLESNVPKCSVCGGTMKMFGLVGSKLGMLNRYKCTCGHCQDLPPKATAAAQNPDEPLILEGFEQTL